MSPVGYTGCVASFLAVVQTGKCGLDSGQLRLIAELILWHSQFEAFVAAAAGLCLLLWRQVVFCVEVC
ncbi:MAG: hypothetical protein ACKESB_02420 [Candidatus Hodgkinia cicadicola]